MAACCCVVFVIFLVLQLAGFACTGQQARIHYRELSGHCAIHRCSAKDWLPILPIAICIS